jgi:hypothetical protein
VVVVVVVVVVVNSSSKNVATTKISTVTTDNTYALKTWNSAYANPSVPQLTFNRHVSELGKKTDLLRESPSIRESSCIFRGCWNIYLSKFAKEVAPAELLIGNTVTAGVNKLLVPGDGSWQHAATREHAHFSLKVSLPEHRAREFPWLSKTAGIVAPASSAYRWHCTEHFVPFEQPPLHLFIALLPSHFYYRLPFLPPHFWLYNTNGRNVKTSRILMEKLSEGSILKYQTELIKLVIDVSCL